MVQKKNKKKNVKYNTNQGVIFLRKHGYYPQPIPEVGKRYHCFDDGKINFSRHFIIKVDEVLNFMQFKKKYPQMVKNYISTTKDCYWLYARRTDKFVITFNGENNEVGVYVRTKNGGWFGIGDWWNSARLDVTSKLWDNLVKDLDDFDYTEEEKQKLLEENQL